MSAYEIFLLTGLHEACAFTAFLKECNPDLVIRSGTTLESLDRQIKGRMARTRLISFLSNVIVPARILTALGSSPYNIHPGPPDYPGFNPVSFALAEGARQFGVTAHVMAARVDTGAIVHLRRFAIPDGATRLSLGDLAYAHAVEVFRFIGAHCARSDEDLPHLDEKWRGRRRTRADFQRLEERAVGQADDARLLRAISKA